MAKLRLVGSEETVQQVLEFLNLTRAVGYQSNFQKSKYNLNDVVVYVTLRVGEGVPCLLCGEIGRWLAHHDQFICHRCRFEVW